MRLLRVLKVVLISVSCLVLGACASSHLYSQLNNYQGQRVGLFSTVGNTAVVSVHTSGVFSSLLHDKTVVYQQSFAQLQLDRNLTQIAAESLKQLYPNLIIIPNRAQHVRAGFSKFDKDNIPRNPDKKLVMAIIKKYHLDHLILITYGTMYDHNETKFGIKCIKRSGSSYTANYFATLQLLDINGKEFSKQSWGGGYNQISTDQTEKFFKDGWRVADDKVLCQNLLNKKLTKAESKNFLDWVNHYYSTTLKKYLKH